MERIYIARGVGGLFKIGRTTNFKKRLLTLRKEFKRHGDKIAEAHAFDEIANAYGAETQMIWFLGEWFERKPGRAREWFLGVDFAIALAEGAAVTIREASRKPHVRLSAEEFARLDARYRREREARQEASRRWRAAYEERMRVPRLLRRRSERTFEAMIAALAPQPPEPQPEAA